jgi:hypothetical protein
MGASGWIYFVPYQSSIEAAFHELQRLIFEGEHYYWRGYTYDDSQIQVMSDKLYDDSSLSEEEIEKR